VIVDVDLLAHQLDVVHLRHLALGLACRAARDRSPSDRFHLAKRQTIVNSVVDKGT
jgi:hypothetical protein